MAQHRDPNGQATAFKYDPLGRIIETVAPTGSKQSFSYDALGNRLSETSGEGHTTTYSYDSMNRVSSKKRPTGGRLSMPMILQVAWQKKQIPTVIAPTMSMTS